ncbi:hypothetical protein PFISCL1PPCAC_11918 [Pristionchus fissidentatus]|uniref:Lipase n=1 Tax=Pristionchus fissidentatus TaxID=1538716 RepID=A0AAV5VMJ1_9BILA|nr:hypothetical protein PFISCL1PPCAC_11918 [Pristionchus fissidentatus]
MTGEYLPIQSTENKSSHNVDRKEIFLRQLKVVAFLTILFILSFIVSQIFLLIIRRNGSVRSNESTVQLKSLSEQHIGVFRLPVHGEFNCEKSLLDASPSSPFDANRVRPADVKYIAAMGDSYMTGFLSYASSVENEESANDTRNSVGNSFIMGGNGALADHLTLANVFRHLNPSLIGYSTGNGLEDGETNLNVARPGMWVNDMQRQARELIRRFGNYSTKSLEEDWKLINIFVGTKDISGYCIGEVGVELLASFRNTGRKEHAVIVQHIFDDLWTPLRKEDSSFNADFYAIDAFHLSNYGNSLQLWYHLVLPDHAKITINRMMSDESPLLLCPQVACPFIRTPDNSVDCD